MLKSLAAAGLVCIALTAPAFAEEMMKCDDASMMKMDEMMKAETDPAMKSGVEMAMKEMDMAKMSMKDAKTDDCMMHMDNAMKAIKK